MPEMDPERVLEILFDNLRIKEGKAKGLIAAKAEYRGKKLFIGVLKGNEKGLQCIELSNIWDLIEEAKESERDRTYILLFLNLNLLSRPLDSLVFFRPFFMAQLLKTLLSIPVRTISIAYSGCMLYESLPFHITDIRAKIERSAISVIPSDIYGSPEVEGLILQCPNDKFLKELGLINRVIRDPEGEGADQVIVIEQFLNRAFKELSRSKIRKLISNRERRVKRAGIMKGKGGSLIKRYIERPIKKAFKRRGQDGYLSLFHRYEKSYKELLSRKLSFSGISNASEWIERIVDSGSFYELFGDFRAERFLDEDMVSRAYLEELREFETEGGFNESLVVGKGRICHIPVVFLVDEYEFMRGSIGIVYGERFRKAVDTAIEEGLPLVHISCGDGFRVQEGVISLIQIAKCIEAIIRLKRQGLPYISVLSHPQLDLSFRLHCLLGDVVIAQEDAMISPFHPFLMERWEFPTIKGLELHNRSKEIYSSIDIFHEVRGVQDVSDIDDMKRVIARYLEFYLKCRRQRAKNRKRLFRT